MSSLNHYKSKLFFALMNLPMNGWRRVWFARKAGVKIKGTAFIGEDVTFDAVYPENIIIGEHVHITKGVTLLTHYLDTGQEGVCWKSGIIEIGDHSFIGTKTIVAKPARIGSNVIVGAGSVVTKDIPSNEVWAGNPARFIKKRNIIDL